MNTNYTNFIYYDIINTLCYLEKIGIQEIEISDKSIDILKKWKTSNIFNCNRNFESLSDIEKDIINCKKCKLHLNRKNTVFGYGKDNALLLFLGDFPENEDDLQGLPFVGKSGQLLDKIISAMKLKRDSVYLCNVLKCKPENEQQVDINYSYYCFNFLKRQIQTIKPKFICALGEFALKSLIKMDNDFSELRGNFYNYYGIKVMSTYHPRILINNPELKKEVWEDIQKLMYEIKLL